ncbi:hypothetical protein EIP86_011579 [Pleurotus ostreatoroseus]|nr:hypothetical protein EIP86_011579 [Pleurotus ostreatoroseus]
MENNRDTALDDSFPATSTSTPLAQQADRETSQLIFQLKIWLREVTGAPEACVQKIRSHLYPDYVGTDDVVEQFIDFVYIIYPTARKPGSFSETTQQLCSILANTLIKHGILDILVDFLLTPTFLEAYYQGKMPFATLIGFVYCPAYLVHLATSEVKSTTIVPLVNRTLREKDKELANLLRVLWDRRHDFSEDPDYPTTRCLRRIRNNHFGSAIFQLILTLERYCHEEEYDSYYRCTLPS